MSSPRSRFYRNNRPFPSLETAPRPQRRSGLPVSAVLGAMVCGCSVGPLDLRGVLPAIGTGPGLVGPGNGSGGGTPAAPPGLPGSPGISNPAPTPGPPRPAVPPKREPDIILPPPDRAPEPVPLEPPASPTPAPRFPAPGYPTPGYPTPGAPGGGNFLPDQALRVLELTNQARAAAGLPGLAGDAALDRLAGSRSQDMGARNYFSHQTPEGTDIFDMLPQLGIPYRTAGENIAMNTASPAQTAKVAFDGWMNSSGHRANILRSTFGKLGIGVYRTGAGKTYLTQVFTD